MTHPECAIFKYSPESSPPAEFKSDIGNQLDYYLSLRREILGPSRSVKEHEFLSRTYAEAIAVRNSRAKEILSPEVTIATQKATKFLHTSPSEAVKRVTCSDGRLIPEVEFGTPNSQHKTIQTPGGELAGIVTGVHGEKIVNEESAFGKLITERLARKDRIVQMLESHVGCAARKAKTERATGSTGPDDGLRRDVLDKKEMAHALQKYTDKYNRVHASENTKEIVPIQTTYNPTDGYMYMGLERDAALQLSEETGYTLPVLDDLARKDKVISTKHLVHQIDENGERQGLTEIGRIFEQFTIADFGWDTSYKGTAKQFWDNIETMVTETQVLEMISQKVQALYPVRDIREIGTRTKLLMMNAYNAFHEKPLREHNETMIAVSAGENGPLEKHNAFGIINQGKSIEKIISSIDLAEGLIRDNRVKGRVQNDTIGREELSDDAFARSAVPILWESEVGGNVDAAVWEKFAAHLQKDRMNAEKTKIIPDNWCTMQHDAFEKHLAGFGLPKELISGLTSLHGDMKELYSPDTTLHDRLLSPRLDVIPVISDASGEIQAIVPFVYHGYES